MKKFIILVFLSVFPVISYAQFYDDEDELYFYDVNDNQPYGDNHALVFNFDGTKGAILNVPGTRLKIVNNLKNDINYFEKQVFKVDYDLKYVGTTSNGMIEYVQRNVYSFPWGVSVCVTHYYFSADRKKLVSKGEEDKYSIEYHKVEKSAFLPGRSRRSLSENDVIYD